MNDRPLRSLRRHAQRFVAHHSAALEENAGVSKTIIRSVLRRQPE